MEFLYKAAEASSEKALVRFPVRMLELVLQEILEQVKEIPLNSVEYGSIGKTADYLHGLTLARRPQPFGPNLTRETTALPESETFHGDTFPLDFREISDLLFEDGGEYNSKIPDNRYGSVMTGEPAETAQDQNRYFSVMTNEACETVQDDRAKGPPSESMRSDAEKERLLAIFRELDTDGGGSISRAELCHGLLKLGVPSARTQRLIDAADKDMSGEVDFDEWRRAIYDGKGFAAKELAALTKDLGVVADEAEEVVVNECCMMRPDSCARISWDVFLGFTCFYVSTVFPFTLGFDSYINATMTRNFTTIDLVIDIIFLTDVLMNFRTGYIDASDGKLIMDWRRVGCAYLYSYFFLDVASSLPLEHLLGEGMAWNRFLKILKLAKILKALKVIGPLLASTSWLNLGDSVHMLLNYPVVRHVVRRSNLLIMLVLLCHWMACFMAFASLEWLEVNESVNSNLGSIYLAALYFACTTTTTVGYGDISATNDLERILSCFAMVIGATFYGYTVGTIASIISSRELQSTAYHDRMDLVMSWLQHHRSKLPKELRGRLIRYFKHVLSQKAVVDEANVMNDLSPSLEKEVGERLIPNTIRLNPLFDGLPFNATIRLLKIANMIPADQFKTVVEPGEAGTSMFIVHRGSLMLDAHAEIPSLHPVLSQSQSGLEAAEPNSRSIRKATRKRITLHMGDSFGEEILLGVEDIYKYRVVALENSELFAIEEGAFERIFHHMPRMMELMLSNTEDVLRLKGYIDIGLVGGVKEKTMARMGAIEDMSEEVERLASVKHGTRGSKKGHESLDRISSSNQFSRPKPPDDNGHHHSQLAGTSIPKNGDSFEI